MATDLAEFLGAALGFHLLFGMALFPAAVITGITAFAILGLQRFGFRPFEAVIAGFVGVIGVCYIAELLLRAPAARDRRDARGQAQFAGSESLLLAVGILGATVMPHVIYLHSALMQDRIVPQRRRRGAARLPLHEDRRHRSRCRSPASSTSRCWSSPRLSSTGPASPTSRRWRPRTRRWSRFSAAPRARCSRSRCSRRACRARPWARSRARSSCRASSTARSRCSSAAW